MNSASSFLWASKSQKDDTERFPKCKRERNWVAEAREEERRTLEDDAEGALPDLLAYAVMDADEVWRRGMSAMGGHFGAYVEERRGESVGGR